jgi:hypothetical protein
MINTRLIDKAKVWLGTEGISFFSHLKGLTGEVSPVLNLNVKRKGIPIHPIHFREGMSIRNWMRDQIECKDWSADEMDEKWVLLIEEVIKK